MFCLISVKQNICFKGLKKRLFCSNNFVAMRENLNFPYIVKFFPCAVASLLIV